jgi:hypothetical protein
MYWMLMGFAAAGSMFGSILGGRWSDRVFNQLKTKNGGTSKPEVCFAF